MKIELHNAIIESVSTRADKSYKVVLGLPELPPEQAVQLFSSLQTSLSQVDIQHDPDVQGKTPSQILRNCFYVLWEQQYQTTYPKFAVYYDAQMEGLINQIKDKLR